MFGSLHRARRAVVAALVTIATFSTTATAFAQTRAQVGTLACDVSAGLGLVIFQKQTMACTFVPTSGGPVSHYLGQIAEFGVALGGVTEGHLVWGVVAATADVGPGALAGTYAGVGAQATAGLGAGANLLIGGTGRAFSLQPLSVEGQTGINIAGGVTSLTLTPAP